MTPPEQAGRQVRRGSESGTERVVVMGVAGSGKSTVGRALAGRLGARFVDGDTLHSARNIELMSSGTPLTDLERWPWLHRVGQVLATATPPVVVACSALARRYRDVIRQHAGDAVFVFLDGPASLLGARLAEREGHFMGMSMLDSQLAALEPLADDECGISLDVRAPPGDVVLAAATYLTCARSADED